MSKDTKPPRTRTKQYRLDVLAGRAISALHDVLGAKDEDAFYELKNKLEEALGNWADEEWPLTPLDEIVGPANVMLGLLLFVTKYHQTQTEETAPAERSEINLETGPKKHG